MAEAAPGAALPPQLPRNPALVAEPSSGFDGGCVASVVPTLSIPACHQPGVPFPVSSG